MKTKFDIEDNVLIRGEVIGIDISPRGELYKIRTHSGISVSVPADDVHEMRIIDEQES